MKNILILAVGLGVIIGGSILWSKSLQPNDPDVVSVKGLHWHPNIEVFVRGEKQTIPANIGIGSQYASNPTFDRQMGMTAVHTHNDAVDGVVHFEFSGVVKKNDLTLKNFLAIWGKEINSFGSNVKMTVNGIENMELGEYSMKDGDKVVLNYE